MRPILAKTVLALVMSKSRGGTLYPTESLRVISAAVALPPLRYW
jgi:hypothetical protein